MATIIVIYEMYPLRFKNTKITLDAIPVATPSKRPCIAKYIEEIFRPMRLLSSAAKKDGTVYDTEKNAPIAKDTNTPQKTARGNKIFLGALLQKNIIDIPTENIKSTYL